MEKKSCCCAGEAETVNVNMETTGVTGAEYQLTGPYGWKIDQAGEIAALTELKHRPMMLSATAATNIEQKRKRKIF